MGKKDAPAPLGGRSGDLILMQETAAMQSGRQHYPQQEAAGGSDMVTPKRASRKRFWQVGGEDGEEVEKLVSAEEPPDHEPSEHDTAGGDLHDGIRAGHFWNTMTSCYHDAHQVAILKRELYGDLPSER